MVLKSYKKHLFEINKLKSSIQKNPKSFSLSRDHSTSNRTVNRKKGVHSYQFNQVLFVKNNIAYVQPRVTFLELVKYLKPMGLCPQIVPEFKGITVGGAVLGAALESASHELGQFNDTCLAYQILDQNLKVLWCSKNKNKDLFHAMTGSYGSLGILLLVKVFLKSLPKTIVVQKESHPSFKSFLSSLKNSSNTYLEGIVYSPQEYVLLKGDEVNASKVKHIKSRWYSPWFFECARDFKQFQMKPIDYFFRTDRGAFWMGSYLSRFSALFLYLFKKRVSRKRFYSLSKELMENQYQKTPLIMRFFLGKLLESKYLYKALHKIPANKFEKIALIQDFYIPYENAELFLEEVLKIGIFPLWLCPIKPSKDQFLSPHYSNVKLLNIGVYGMTQNADQKTKQLEELCYRLKGRKMLYAKSFYEEKRFWEIYNEDKFTQIRKKYHLDQFPTLYQKIRAL